MRVVQLNRMARIITGYGAADLPSGMDARRLVIDADATRLAESAQLIQRSIIRDCHGDWHPLVEYIRPNSDAEVTHGMSPNAPRRSSKRTADAWRVRVQTGKIQRKYIMRFLRNHQFFTLARLAHTGHLRRKMDPYGRFSHNRLRA